MTTARSIFLRLLSREPYLLGFAALILAMCGAVMMGCAPKYGPGYKSYWGARIPHPDEPAGNYRDDGIIEINHFDREPVAFAWRGDQLWILWKVYGSKNPQSIVEHDSYEIIPHPVDRGIGSVRIFDIGDWRSYRNWIEAGAPRTWEASRDSWGNWKRHDAKESQE